ncbi:hypothetical protein C8R43DRAFT_958821 [Mycena crocata]|nr:hypothetical protein C8R43DRAFT_958821 [Mycena crocata]
MIDHPTVANYQQQSAVPPIAIIKPQRRQSSNIQYASGKPGLPELWPTSTTGGRGERKGVALVETPAPKKVAQITDRQFSHPMCRHSHRDRPSNHRKPLATVDTLADRNIFLHQQLLTISPRNKRSAEQSGLDGPAVGIHITVLGPFPRAEFRMPANSTISDVLDKLQKMHKIGAESRLQHQVIFPSYKKIALELTDTFCRLGVKDLAVLHVRSLVLGGTANSTDEASGDNAPGPSGSGSGSHNRETNSPLFCKLPWSVDGLSDDSWRKWIHDLPQTLSSNIPQWISFVVGMKVTCYPPRILNTQQELLSNIHEATRWYFPRTTSGKKATASEFFGFEKPRFRRPGITLKLEDDSVYGIRLLNFLALRMGMEETGDEQEPRYRWPSDLAGNTLTRLKDWSSVVDKAVHLRQERLDSLNRASASGHVPGVGNADPDPSNSLPVGDDLMGDSGDCETSKQIQALFDNLSCPFLAEDTKKIIDNLSLAGFMLGWHFQGNFKLPGTTKELLIELSKYPGLKKLVDEQGGLLLGRVKETTVFLQRPLKLALLISPLVLLLCVMLYEESYNDAQLIKLFQSLGRFRPAVLKSCEEAVMDQVWMLARGLRTPEQAFLCLAANLSKILRSAAETDLLRDWFQDPEDRPQLPVLLEGMSTKVANSPKAESLEATGPEVTRLEVTSPEVTSEANSPEATSSEANNPGDHLFHSYGFPDLEFSDEELSGSELFSWFNGIDFINLPPFVPELPLPTAPAPQSQLLRGPESATSPFRHYVESAFGFSQSNSAEDSLMEDIPLLTSFGSETAGVLVEETVVGTIPFPDAARPPSFLADDEVDFVLPYTVTLEVLPPASIFRQPKPFETARAEVADPELDDVEEQDESSPERTLTTDPNESEAATISPCRDESLLERRKRQKLGPAPNVANALNDAFSFNIDTGSLPFDESGDSDMDNSPGIPSESGNTSDDDSGASNSSKSGDDHEMDASDDDSNSGTLKYSESGDEAQTNVEPRTSIETESLPTTPPLPTGGIAVSVGGIYHFDEPHAHGPAHDVAKALNEPFSNNSDTASRIPSETGNTSDDDSGASNSSKSGDDHEMDASDDDSNSGILKSSESGDEAESNVEPRTSIETESLPKTPPLPIGGMAVSVGGISHFDEPHALPLPDTTRSTTTFPISSPSQPTELSTTTTSMEGIKLTTASTSGKRQRSNSMSDLSSLSGDDGHNPTGGSKPKKKKKRKKQQKDDEGNTSTFGSDPDYKPANGSHKKLRQRSIDAKAAHPVSANATESDDSEAGKVPFVDLTREDEVIDLTGEDVGDLKAPALISLKTHKTPENITRDVKSYTTLCFSSTVGEVLKFSFHGWCRKFEGPGTVTRKTSEDHEYRFLEENEATFKTSFITSVPPVPGHYRIPKFWSISARNPEYTEGCSLYFLSSRFDWQNLTPYKRHEILERRQIVIQSLSEQLPGPNPVNMSALELMGISRQRPLELHDLSRRTVQRPNGGVITAIPQDFIEEANKGSAGKILCALDIPMHLAGANDPEGLKDMNTSEAALSQTYTMTGCQFLGQGDIHAHTKWGMAVTAGASTHTNCSQSAILLNVRAGSVLWYCVTEGMESIHSFDNWEATKCFPQGRSLEGILLRAGDVLIMRPNTLYYMMAIEPSIIWGRNFHAMATMPDSVWGFIHTSLSGRPLPNTGHEDASVFFLYIQAYWFANFKLVHNGEIGEILSEITDPHVPKINTWKGLLWMLCLGNLVMVLEALDWRNYLDLEVNNRDHLPKQAWRDEHGRRRRHNAQHILARKTFAEFRTWFSANYVVRKGDEDVDKSFVHLATMLVFYNKTRKYPADSWSAEAFQTKLEEVFPQYSSSDGTSGDDTMLELYKVSIAAKEPVANGCFLPDNWTETSFLIERIP